MIRLCLPYRKKLYLIFLVLLILTFNSGSPSQHNVILLGRFEKNIVEPLFIYQNGIFKSASVVEENPDINKSILTQFKTLYLYSKSSDYAGQAEIEKITVIEVGCVRKVVGKLKNADAEKSGFCFNLPIPQKKFYKETVFSRADTILALNFAYQIINNFIKYNNLKLKINSFEVENLAKFDFNDDDNLELFAKIKANIIDMSEEGNYILTSFIISSNQIAFLSTTYIDLYGETIAGDHYTIDFEFACDVDADSIAEVVVIVGYYESWGYKILKFYRNRFIEIATADGGGC